MAPLKALTWEAAWSVRGLLALWSSQQWGARGRTFSSNAVVRTLDGMRNPGHRQLRARPWPLPHPQALAACGGVGGGARFWSAHPTWRAAGDEGLPDSEFINGRFFPAAGAVFSATGEVGGKDLVLETGKMARLAAGAVVASVGGTRVLVTVASRAQERGAGEAAPSFVPLTVDYREKQAAIGKIPSTFMRREGMVRDREVLCSRSIDRSVRPLFPPGFGDETQIIASILSFDGSNDPDIIAINATSAALTLSDVPWGGPIGAVRVGRVEGKYVINPTLEQLAESDLNLVYSCTADKTVMVECHARPLSNEALTEALGVAHAEASKLVAPQLALAAMVRNKKRPFSSPPGPDPMLAAHLREILPSLLADVLGQPSSDKMERGRRFSVALADARAALAERGVEAPPPMVEAAFEKLKKELVRMHILDGHARVDGRGVDELREIQCEVGTMEELHGCSLFTRGNTQAFCTVTLGRETDAVRADPLAGQGAGKRFFVHYSFPPFAINEVFRLGSANRREIGHGNLAEKAIMAVLDESSFPFAVRLTSECLASDGSSSMATVCGGSLALMDAGIPLSEHVAGVSMGLVSERDPETGELQRYQLLTDILGLEDHLGDMDFKIAGTVGGVTAVQLDMKVPGIPLPVLCKALAPAERARVQIIEQMKAAIPETRKEPRENAPRAGHVDIERELVGRLIGPGGSNIKRIELETGARLQFDSTSGRVQVYGATEAAYDAGVAAVKQLLGESVVAGSVYKGTVVDMRDFGAFVMLEGGTTGLLHISEIAHERIEKVEQVLALGQELEVLCVTRDFKGNLKLSRKALLPPPTPAFLPGAVRPRREGPTNRKWVPTIAEGHEGPPDGVTSRRKDGASSWSPSDQEASLDEGALGRSRARGSGSSKRVRSSRDGSMHAAEPTTHWEAPKKRQGKVVKHSCEEAAQQDVRSVDVGESDVGQSLGRSGPGDVSTEEIEGVNVIWRGHLGDVTTHDDNGGLKKKEDNCRNHLL